MFTPRQNTPCLYTAYVFREPFSYFQRQRLGGLEMMIYLSLVHLWSLIARLLLAARTELFAQAKTAL
jgi:hypothetical protein